MSLLNQAELCTILLQELAPLGLRTIFLGGSENKKGVLTLSEVLALFRILKTHNRVTFLVVAGIPPETEPTKNSELRSALREGKLRTNHLSPYLSTFIQI